MDCRAQQPNLDDDTGWASNQDSPIPFPNVLVTVDTS